MLGKIATDLLVWQAHFDSQNNHYSTTAMSINIQLDHLQFRQRFQPQQHRFCLLAHDIVEALNIGSLFRLADALGMEKIWLTGASALPPDAKIRRTSRATEQYVAHEYRADVLALVAELQAAGYVIICLELTSQSVDVRRLALAVDAPICLIPGSENSGVCQALLDVSEHVVHLPMQGNNSSMNVAMACGIAAFELLRGRLT